MTGIKYWNGSSWIAPVAVYYWDGVQWAKVFPSIFEFSDTYSTSKAVEHDVRYSLNLSGINSETSVSISVTFKGDHTTSCNYTASSSDLNEGDNSIEAFGYSEAVSPTKCVFFGTLKLNGSNVANCSENYMNYVTQTIVTVTVNNVSDASFVRTYTYNEPGVCEP